VLTWLITSGLAAVYCLARAVVDLLQKRYVWAVMGLLAAIALVAVPIPTHAIKLDVPLDRQGS
jgi:hypothetical protein